MPLSTKSNKPRRAAFIVLACLCLPPLIIGGLVKAGYYTFVTRVLPPWRCQWYIGPTDVMLDHDAPVRGYRLTLNEYDVAVYSPQDIPPREYLYWIDAQVVDVQGHGIPYADVSIYNPGSLIMVDPQRAFRAWNAGEVSEAVGLQGVYDVAAARHGYLSIKKRVTVGPHGASIKFVLPRALHGGRPK